MNIRLYIVIMYFMVAPQFVLPSIVDKAAQKEELKKQLGITSDDYNRAVALLQELYESEQRKKGCFAAAKQGSVVCLKPLVDEIIRCRLIKNTLCTRYPKVFYMDPSSSELLQFKYERKGFVVKCCGMMIGKPPYGPFYKKQVPFVPVVDATSDLGV